jgi:hypothetical protein
MTSEADGLYGMLSLWNNGSAAQQPQRAAHARKEARVGRVNR